VVVHEVSLSTEDLKLSCIIFGQLCSIDVEILITFLIITTEVKALEYTKNGITLSCLVNGRTLMVTVKV